MRVTNLLTNFTAGEMSPRLWGRVDIAKYRNGCRTLQNFIVMPHGGATKRPGTRFVWQTRDNAIARPVPFEFNVEQAYMLEFGANYIRVFKDGGIVLAVQKSITGISQADPAVVQCTGHGFSAGQRVIISGVAGMTEINNREFEIGSTPDANSFTLLGVDATGYTAYSGSGTAGRPVEVTTTYALSELGDLSFAQSADTLYIAHKMHPLAKLTRTSHTAWTLADVDVLYGPFRTINDDDDWVISVAVTAGSASIQDITQASPAVVTTTAAHGLSDGETVKITSVSGMTEVNDQYFIVRNPTSTTFELYSNQNTGGSLGGGSGGTMAVPVDSTGYTTYSSGGSIARSSTLFGTVFPGTPCTLTATKDTWTNDNIGCLFRLWEPGQTSGVISAPVGNGSIALSNGQTYTNDGKVYGVTNINTWTTWANILRVPNHDKGTVRVSGTGGSFDAVYLHDASCVVRITGFTDEQTVSAEVVKNHIPASVVDNGTSAWEEGAWSVRRGYPGLVTFHEQRLWTAASTTDPQTVWASRTAAFENFQDGPEDDDALIYTLASERVESIRWMSPGKTMVLGTASGEYAVAASNQNEALTPSNVRITRQTPFGSGPLRVTRISNAVLFGQRNGDPDNAPRKIRELVYSYENDSYVAADLTILSEHITGAGLIDLSYQPTPDSLAWAARADGQLVGVTYEREQQVVGWHRHVLGGAGTVLRMAVIPGSDGDQVWLLVERTIDSQTVRYWEYIGTGMRQQDDKEDGAYVDASATYEGPETNEITGLAWLEGQAVDVLNNGAVERGLTVTGGKVTLANATTKAHVGLRYTSILETMDLEGGAAAGTAQSRQKRIAKAFPRVYRSLGGKVGPSSSKLEEIQYRTPEMAMDTSPDLKTGHAEVDFPSGWDREAMIYIEHDDPLPFTVLGIAAELNTTG